MCSSPRLFAAYHALHRLSMPRHPPCALLRLISIRLVLDTTYYGVIPSLGHVPDKGHDRTSLHPRLSKSSEGLGGEPAKCGRHQTPFTTHPKARPTRHSRKEVIQPQVPLRLPCYDFAPVTELTFGGCLLAVSPPTSGPPSFHGVTGGVYKARERIHRGVADPRLLAIPASCGRVAARNPNLDQVSGIRSTLRSCSPLSWPL